MRTSEKHRNKFLGSDQKFKNLFRNLGLELKGFAFEKVDVKVGYICLRPWRGSVVA